MIKILVFFLLIKASCSFTKTLEAYGDSLTAGFLSNTTLQKNTPLSSIGNIISNLAMYGITKETKYISEYLRYDLSWPFELSKLNEEIKYEVINLAFLAAKTIDLINQISNAPNNVKDTLSLFFIGYNDLCPRNGPPQAIIDSYIANYEKALKFWEKTHSNSSAYIIMLVNFSKIFKVLKNFVWYENGKIEYTCFDCWEKFFPYCPAYSILERNNLLESYVTNILDELEIRLSTLASILNIESNNKNTFTVINPWPGNEVLTEYFAIDCFHISHAGQKFVAKLINENIKFSF